MAPFVEVTPVLMKLVSGCRDSTWFCFRLAGTVDGMFSEEGGVFSEGDVFSEGGMFSEGDMFSKGGVFSEGGMFSEGDVFSEGGVFSEESGMFSEGGMFSLPGSWFIFVEAPVSSLEMDAWESETGNGADGGVTVGSWVGVVSGGKGKEDGTAALKRSSLHFSNSVGDNLRKRVAPDSNDAIRTETSFRETISLGLQNVSSGQPSMMTWYFSVMERSKFV